MSSYDDDSSYNQDYSDDECYFDYDPAEHMMRDPVGFQMYGYGGFGYDTSHVPPDEAKPEIVRRAEDGDLDAVRRLVEEAAAVSYDEKNATINRARRWTEVDYRMSGFTKEYEWFDLTPLAAAASAGRHDVVQYLLEEGADPTLKGCPTEDVHVNALDAAVKLLEKSQVAERKASAGSSSKNEGIMHRCSKRCVDLLKAAGPFWKDAPYSHSRYSQTARAKFSNAPTDLAGLPAAVRAVPALADVPPRADKENSVNGTSKGRQAGKKKDAHAAAAKPKAGGNRRVCSRCQEAKPTGSFSKNQRTKGAAARCKDCVEEAQSKPAKVDQETKPRFDALATIIDDGIETVREDAKLRLAEMQENQHYVEDLQRNIESHGGASAPLRDRAERLVSASNRARAAIAEVVKLVREIENIALEDGVVPED